MVKFSIILPDPLRYYSIGFPDYKKMSHVPEDVRKWVENYFDELLKDSINKGVS